jgi:hypothetical protein
MIDGFSCKIEMENLDPYQPRSVRLHQGLDTQGWQTRRTNLQASTLYSTPATAYHLHDESFQCENIY